MPWFKVDDGFWSHPKVLELEPAAVALWVRAGSYCAQHLTDGVVTAGVIRTLGADRSSADELVMVDLWEQVDDRSWAFKSWSEYQPTRDDVEAERTAARERMRERRRNKRGKFEGSSPEHPTNVREKFVNGSSTPTRPDPTPSSKELGDPPTPQRGKRKGTRLDPRWMPTTELVQQMQAECPGVDLKAEHRVFVDYWIAQPGQKGVKVDWPATWRNWMRRKQGDVKKTPRTFGQMKQDNSLSIVERYRQEESRAEIGSGDAADVRALDPGW